MNSWRDRAACRGLDPNIFFPNRWDYAGIERARQTCAGCGFTWECLSYAVETNQTEGIWGGTTQSERRRVRRLRMKKLGEVS